MKIRTLLLITGTCLLLSGCGDRQIPESPQEIQKPEESLTGENEPSEDRKKQEEIVQEQETDEESLLLLFYQRKLIQVDKNGRAQELVTTAKRENIVAACYGGESIYFAVNYYDDDWNSLYTIYKMEPGKAADLQVVEEEFSWGDKLEFYDGSLHISRKEQIDEGISVEKNAVFCEANDRYLIYEFEDTDYQNYFDRTCHVIIYDKENETKSVLYEGKSVEKMMILELEDDAVYYYRTQIPEYERSLRRVYRYDISEEKESFLYEAYDVVGEKDFVYLETGIAGFQVQDGICYYLTAGERDYQWCRFDSNKEHAAEEPIGIVEAHFDFTDYGTVDYAAERYTIGEDDTELFGYYIEEFAFKDQYEHAQEANELLHLWGQENIDYAKRQAENLTEDEFTLEAIQGGYWTCNSYTIYLTSVEDIKKNRYISVNYSGYEYMGGAHGMPFHAYYLFDMDTGREAFLSDFYTGTEEEFKQIVAEYSVAHWKENPDRYFGWENEESAYGEFYENAMFTMPMRFTKEGLMIEYLPYEYGPYASGFMEILIPYEKLGIFEE